nr:protein-glutamine gamma-glutamyltransferase 2-like [Anolis sagrei ordinatus]
MATVLELAAWDLLCERNNEDHRTSDAGSQRLLVRRGQTFFVTLHFSRRPFDEAVDKLTFHVETGPCPNETSGTKSSFPVSCSLEKTAWSSAVESQDKSSLTVFVFPPPDARIGRYRLTLDTSTKGQGYCYYIGEFILLFNPWCIGDTVYMESEEARIEYVLTQHGQIFMGDEDYMYSIPWMFGQFEKGIVAICLQMLDTSLNFLRDQDKDCSLRNSPIYVSRVVCAMVNCNDDQGILSGRWDNCYVGGVHPNTWSGSVNILQRWQKSGCQPVHYGQCWVFAAVACTVLRCLGIPTRVVTNYKSAHDANGNLIVEHFLDENGDLLPGLQESCWNFHCWVESWMGRPDLPEGYDGWQVLDPTPQEQSEGIFCCGPASVKAIKEGDIHLKYDVPFVFAEVNADEVWYMRQHGMPWKVISIDTSAIGVNISTKSVGRETREDITHCYKYPEGSMEERATFAKARQKVQHKDQLKDSLPMKNTLKVRIKTSEGINNGCDFHVFAVIENTTAEKHRCKLTFAARTKSYNGVLGPEFRSKDMLNITLEPYEEKTIPFNILYKNYSRRLTQDNMIRVSAFLVDQDTQECCGGTRDIYIKNPDIKIRILGEPMQNRRLMAEVALTNPLPVPLTDCVFTVQGAGLTGGQKIQKIYSPVGPGEEAKAKVDFVPFLSGLRKLVINFESNKLKGVKGYYNINVAPIPI